MVVRIFSADLIHGKGHLFWPFKARRVSIKAGYIILSWIHALPKMINICRRKGRYFTHIDTLCKYCKPIWTVIGSIFDPLSIENFSFFSLWNAKIENLNICKQLNLLVIEPGSALWKLLQNICHFIFYRFAYISYLVEEFTTKVPSISDQ